MLQKVYNPNKKYLASCNEYLPGQQLSSCLNTLETLLWTLLMRQNNTLQSLLLYSRTPRYESTELILSELVEVKEISLSRCNNRRILIWVERLQGQQKGQSGIMLVALSSVLCNIHIVLARCEKCETLDSHMAFFRSKMLLRFCIPERKRSLVLEIVQTE